MALEVYVEFTENARRVFLATHGAGPFSLRDFSAAPTDELPAVGDEIELYEISEVVFTVVKRRFRWVKSGGKQSAAVTLWLDAPGESTVLTLVENEEKRSDLPTSAAGN